jgi:serine protease Do
MQQLNRLSATGCLAAMIAAVAGCTTHQSFPTVTQGRTTFASLQRAVAATGKTIETGLVLVKIQKDKPPSQPTVIGGITINTANATPTSFSGIVLTREGFILVPAAMKTEPEDRISAWIGDNEHLARVVKTDDTLGMSIVKIHVDEPLAPVSLTNNADFAVGEWGVVMLPSDEEYDYQKIRALTTCRAAQAGRYRRFLLATAPRDAEGSPVLNLSGQIVGFLNMGAVLSLSDMQEDMKSFIAESTGGRTDGEDKPKGWLGAALTPINKEYAQLHKLPVSSLWVSQVSSGGPAATAGMRTGDLVMALNGQPLRLTGFRVYDYFIKALRLRVGNPFEVTVMREGKTVTLRGKITKRPEVPTLRAEDLGIVVSGITESEAFLNNLACQQGVLVTDVVRGSPAAMSGTFRKTLLSKMDVIVELNGQATPTVSTFNKALETVRQQHPPTVLVKYWRGPISGYAALNMKIGEKENGGVK